MSGRAPADPRQAGQHIAVGEDRRVCSVAIGRADVLRSPAPARGKTRHKDLSVLFDRYIRPIDALEFSSSKDLGL